MTHKIGRRMVLTGLALTGLGACEATLTVGAGAGGLYQRQPTKPGKPTKPRYLTEDEMHQVARQLGVKSFGPWEFTGPHANAARRMLNKHIPARDLVCRAFIHRVYHDGEWHNVRMLACTTYSRVDRVRENARLRRQKGIQLNMRYLPQARRWGLSSPVFLDNKIRFYR